MRTRLLAVVTAASVLLSAPLVVRAQKESDEAQRLRDAITAFNEIMSADDEGIPRSVLAKAEGVALFPNTVKAGFVFGGMRGRGILSVRNQGNWSSPAFLTLTGGSFGLQIGGQATDLVLVIMNRRGLENLVRNQFKLGADASVAAGPVGREAQAATDLQLRAQILSYSRSRGAFAGVTIDGSTIRQDRDAIARFYGTRFDADQVLFGGQAGSPEPVGLWLQTLDRFTR